MRHLKARQVESGPHAGCWHYTSEHDGHIHPVGHCSSIKACSDCNVGGHRLGAKYGDKTDCRTCAGEGWAVKTDAERCWHATAEEAADHYKASLLDRAFYAEAPFGRQAKHECQAPDCEEFTFGGATVGGYQAFHLCDTHRNRETLERLVSVGESWES